MIEMMSMQEQQRGSGKPGAFQGSTLRRGMQVLEVLTRRDPSDDDGIGPSEIARRIGCDKSQVSRTLAVLEEIGLVERVIDGNGYRPSWALYGLGIRGANVALVQASVAVLQQVAATLGESTYLTVRAGDRVLAVWSAASQDPANPVGRAGLTWTLYASAAGTTLLMDHSRKEVNQILAMTPLERFTDNTPTTLDQVWKRVAEARRRGFAVSDREWDAGLTAVAAPIRGPYRDIVASVAVSGTPERILPVADSVAAHVVQATRVIGQRMRARNDARTQSEPLPRWLRRLI